MNKKGNKIIGGIISLVMLIVCLVLLQGIITANSANFTGVSSTILTYIIPIALLGALVVAGMLASGKRR